MKQWWKIWTTRSASAPADAPTAGAVARRPSIQHHENYSERTRQHLHSLELVDRERSDKSSDMTCAQLRHMRDAISKIGRDLAS